MRGASVSEQLLLNTEQTGVLLVSTLNTTTNETVRMISNPNIGRTINIINLRILCSYLYQNRSLRMCTYIHTYVGIVKQLKFNLTIINSLLLSF